MKRILDKLESVDIDKSLKMWTSKGGEYDVIKNVDYKERMNESCDEVLGVSLEFLVKPHTMKSQDMNSDTIHVFSRNTKHGTSRKPYCISIVPKFNGGNYIRHRVKYLGKVVKVEKI